MAIVMRVSQGPEEVERSPLDALTDRELEALG
jgi:hypothetical protein